MPSRQHETIAEAANACLSSFQECMRLLTSFGPRERAIVQNQLGRFSLWAANIGVYAPGRASMDYRLREVEDVHRVVRGLLEALNSSLVDCESGIKSWAMALDNDKSENSEESVQDAMSTFERVIQILAEDITLLHQLSNTIRRAGRESQNSKSAAYFEIKDNDGNNIEDALQAAFLHNLLDQFPNSEESLLARLASTMVVRRKQILYRRSRRPKAVKSLPGIIPKSTFSLAPEEPVTVYLMASDDDCTVQRFQREAAATPHKPKFSVVQSQAKTTTTLDLEKLRQASTPSVISGTRTISLRQDNNLVFPPPPRASIRDRFNQLKSRHRDERDAQLALLPNYALYIENKENQSLEPPVFEKLMEQVQEVHKQYHMAVEADRKACDTMETEAICPYCLETLSSGKMKDLRKWREHLKNDLNPYVCLFRDCGKPETLYSHSEQWLAHMKQHALRWTCNAKSHEPLTFLAKDKYEDHMKTRHRGAFSDAQLSAISERNARTFGPLFSSCPLCGIGLGDDGLPDTLEGHIVGHLRFLALKSLPLIEEELEDSDSSRSAASNDSAKPLDRSTLRDLLGHDSQLQYDSLQSNLQASIPFSSAGEPGDTNAFSPWGGLRHYIGNSSAQTLTRTSSEGMGDDAILIFQHPYRHWRDDDIRDILSVMFTFRGINTTSSKSHFSDPFNEVSLNSEMRLKRMLQLRIASFGPEGCPECGATDLVVSEDIARHLLLHGDPDWFVDPEDWLPDATNGNIREAQWGQVLEVSAEVYESEQDPILQHFLDQAQSARICSEQWAAKDGCDSLISALEDGALRCAESSKIFVPYDLLKSTLTTIRIEAALMEAGTDPDKIPELRKLVERYAHRIFATLLELHGLKHLPVLANYRFYDAALLQHRDDIWGLARVPTEDIPLAKFREASWKFRAPVFADDKFEYEVNEESPLAFVQWERHSSCNAYSQVYKAELHPAHMTVAPRLPYNNPYKVAVKILDHRVIEEDFLAENDVLWLMRQVEHKHLMKPIAAYVMGPKRAFILPWAEGNLNDLWARQEVEPYDKPAWTRWFLKQMRNLADAISLLYDEPEYCVHQSFAPSNIMWLDGNNISLSEDEEFGILLVGNSGITKQCVGELDLAKESGSRYLAPEATGGFTRINGEIEGIDGLVQSGSIHRRLSKVNFNFADSWSLGCICLEFIVWLLCGYPDLMAFREQTAEGFYQSGGRRRQYVQHRVVRAKIHDLKTHPLCTQSRPIGALLRLIQTRLLTVKTTARWMRAGSPPLPQTSHRTTTRNLWEWLCLACMVVESEDSEFSGVLPNFESRMKHMAQTASASGGAAMYFQQDDLREDTSTPLDESEAQEEPDSNSSDRDTDEL